MNSLIINILVDDSTQNGSDANTAGNTSSLVNLDIDLSRIPFTISEQDSVKDIIAKLKYELGNLFFLQLELLCPHTLYNSLDWLLLIVQLHNLLS